MPPEDRLQDKSKASDGLEWVADGLGKAIDGTGKVKDGWRKIKDGLGKVKGGFGNTSDEFGKANNGSGKLNDAFGNVNYCSRKVNDGFGNENYGSVKVNDGAAKVNCGPGKVNDGPGKVKDGFEKANDGYGKVGIVETASSSKTEEEKRRSHEGEDLIGERKAINPSWENDLAGEGTSSSSSSSQPASQISTTVNTQDCEESEGGRSVVVEASRSKWPFPPPSPARTQTGSPASNAPPRLAGSGVSFRRLPRPASPRPFGEGDGYNSADEQNSWASGPSVFGDNEERERQFELDLMRAKGLEVRHMAEDGNCLFRSVADQVYGDAEMHEEIRQLCIDYMEKERDHFAQFVTEGFTAYCKRKRRDKVYGNNLEIQAMAEMYNRPIHIYSYSIEPINIFQGGYETDLPPIRLSYHRGNHYNSLVDPRTPTVGAGLGFGCLHGTNADRDQVKAAIKAQQDQLLEKALIAEGQYYSDLELTEQEMERMVMEASRVEFHEQRQQQTTVSLESSTSTTATGAEPSSSAASGKGNVAIYANPSPPGGSTKDLMMTSNMRMLLTMGFNYLRVLEASSIFGDDVNDMLCYLLEVDTSSPPHKDSSDYRLKGKAAEK